MKKKTEFFIAIIILLIIVIGILTFYELQIHKNYTGTIIKIENGKITMEHKNDIQRTGNFITEDAYNTFLSISKSVYEFNANNAIIKDIIGNKINVDDLKVGDTIEVIDKADYPTQDATLFMEIDGTRHMITNLDNIKRIKKIDNY